MSEAIDTRPPSEYLSDQPTEHHHKLGQMLGLSDGHGVPWWMFAMVADRLHVAARWISEADMWRRWIIRGVVAVVTIGATNVGTFAYGCSSRLQAQAAASAQAAEMRREIDALEGHVWDLRVRLGATDQRRPGIAPPPSPPAIEHGSTPDSMLMPRPSVFASPLDLGVAKQQGSLSCRKFVVPPALFLSP